MLDGKTDEFIHDKKNLFWLNEESLISELRCVHCDLKNLGVSKCELTPDGKHMLSKSLIDKIHAKIKENFKKIFSISEKDGKNQSKDEDISKNIKVIPYLNNIFPDSKLEEFMEKESKYINAKNKAKLSEYANLKLQTLFTNELSIKYSTNDNLEKMFASYEYSKFEDNFVRVIKEKIFDEENFRKYSQYIKNHTLYNLNEDLMKNTLKKTLQNLKELDDTNDNPIIYKNVLNFLKIDMIIQNLDTVEKKTRFMETIKRNEDLNKDELNDFENFIDHLILAKIYRKVNAIVYLPKLKSSFKTKFMNTSISNQVEAVNFNYDLGIFDFIVKYKYIIKDNKITQESKRKISINVGSDKNTKYIIDYLNFYLMMDIDNYLIQIIYKNREDYRVKQKQNLFVEDSEGDYFSLLFSDNSKIVFSLVSDEVYFTGPIDSIENIISYLKDKYSIEFHSPEFMEFQGNLRIETSANLTKKVIQEIFNHNAFRNYWITKKQTNNTNNHSYVYWSENNMENFPTTFDNWINFKIDFHSKKDIVYNNWEINFEGNSVAFLQPFISKIISIVHLMENISFNKSFQPTNEAIEKYTHFLKKESSEKKSKSDNSSYLIAQNEIAKREIYNKAIKYSLRGMNLKENFNSRSKPLIFHERNFNKIIMAKWKRFYASISLNKNLLFLEDKSKYMEPPENMIVKVEENIKFVFNDDRQRGLQIGKHYIGLIYEGLFLLPYPEKGKISKIEIVNNVYKKESSLILNKEGSGTSGNIKSSSKKKAVSSIIREVVDRFTTNKASKTVFYFPGDNEYQNFRDFLDKTYPNRKDIYALVKQHLWDHTNEEIEETFKSIDISIHQDLLQHFHKSLIFYFVYDSQRKQYLHKQPRHKFFYCHNREYDHVMFIFKSSKERTDVIYFEDDQYKIPINDQMKNFIKTQAPNPITTNQLKNLLDIDGDIVKGQIFDSNGKSCGLRIQRSNKIMDLRYNPQYSLYLDDYDTSFNFGEIKDSKTNVNEKFGNFANDDRFILVPKKTTNVKYKISKIAENLRSWKQEVYIFQRILITLWFLFNNDKQENYIYKKEDVQLFINTYLGSHIDTDRKLKKQNYENLIVIKRFDHIRDFIDYVSEIYPNRFYGGKLRVRNEELDEIREYMEREIMLIKNYPPSFKEEILNSRTILNLIKDKEDLRGRDEIAYNNFVLEIKKNNLIHYSYKFSKTFSEKFDPKDTDINSKETKAELILIPFMDKYFFLRLTEKGNSLTAVYACIQWKEKKEIISYYSKEQKRSPYIKNFKLVGSDIVESDKNDFSHLSIPEEDYCWILGYELSSGGIVYAAMLPIEI